MRLSNCLDGDGASEAAVFPSAHYLVVAQGSGVEGSYGHASSGARRTGDLDGATPSNTCPVTSCAADLILSEYVEGSGNNKGIELFNGTSSPVDLAAGGYVYQDHHNGSAGPLHTVALAGVVPAGRTFELCHASWALTPGCDQQTADVDFNGDDVVLLRKGGPGGPVVDSIGRIGEDPGSQWGLDPTGTADSTLRRKAAIFTGDTDPNDAFDPAAQWDGWNQNDVADFGVHTQTCP